MRQLRGWLPEDVPDCFLAEPQGSFASHLGRVRQADDFGTSQRLSHCATGSCGVKESMTRQQILDLYFMDARCKLIDLAAFLDRVDRAEGEAGFRFKAFRQALKELDRKDPQRAKHVLLALSDPTTKPISKATTKAACGAHNAVER